MVTPALNFKIKIGFEWLCMQFFVCMLLLKVCQFLKWDETNELTDDMTSPGAMSLHGGF